MFFLAKSTIALIVLVVVFGSVDSDVMAAPLAGHSVASYSFVNKVRMDGDNNIPALHQIVAEKLIELCYSTDHLTDLLSCPDYDHFSQQLSEMANDKDYIRAVSEIAGADILKRMLVGRNTLQRRDRLNEAHHLLKARGENISPSQYLFQVEFSESVEKYKHENEIFTHLIRGLFTTNLSQTTKEGLYISPERYQFLREFRSVSGDMLFSSSLLRISAAMELKDKNLSYDFLNDEESWLLNGRVVKWMKAEQELLNLYFYLDSLSYSNQDHARNSEIWDEDSIK